MRYLGETVEHYLNRTSKYADLEYLHGVEVKNFSKVRIKHGLDDKIECGVGHTMDTILK